MARAGWGGPGASFFHITGPVGATIATAFPYVEVTTYLYVLKMEFNGPGTADDFTFWLNPDLAAA